MTNHFETTMKNLKNILKTGLAAALIATITVACGDRPKTTLQMIPALLKP
jgi:hypothetical protein